MLSIRELKGAEIEDYSRLLMERCRWLMARGIAMWSPEKLSVEGLYKRYANPIFFGGFEGELMAGGFILIEQDLRYWPECTRDRAYYFHKFVVGPQFGGRGYSDTMLAWVKGYGKDMGKDYLRLDYQKRRDYLRAMYLRNGFVDKREVVNDEGDSLLLAEYRIA